MGESEKTLPFCGTRACLTWGTVGSPLPVHCSCDKYALFKWISLYRQLNFYMDGVASRATKCTFWVLQMRTWQSHFASHRGMTNDDVRGSRFIIFLYLHKFLIHIKHYYLFFSFFLDNTGCPGLTFETLFFFKFTLCPTSFEDLNRISPL